MRATILHQRGWRATGVPAAAGEEHEGQLIADTVALEDGISKEMRQRRLQRREEPQRGEQEGGEHHDVGASA